MAFFARPNLDDTQFKQLENSELTLSGQTRIATTSGLTLMGDSSTYIPIQVTGATNTDVLTYDSTDGVIRLKPSTGGGGVYTYSGLTTCAVGGLTTGQDLFNDPIQDIINCMVSPTIFPSLVAPKINSFTLSPTTTTYEIGELLFALSGTLNFNAGSISPVYSPTACSCRSCGTECYIYNVRGDIKTCITNAPSNVMTFADGSNPIWILQGSNTILGTICYCQGVQPYDSSGSPYCSPLATGSVSTSKVISGILPYYWGIEASGSAPAGDNRPTPASIKSIIESGAADCCVKVSTSTICINFNSTGDDYLWFAVPEASQVKTWWYVDDLNQNPIGGAITSGGNLFPDPESTINFNFTKWQDVGIGDQTFNIYISNYQSEATKIMELRNL